MVFQQGVGTCEKICADRRDGARLLHSPGNTGFFVGALPRQRDAFYSFIRFHLQGDMLRASPQTGGDDGPEGEN